jgi:hypothetical protein
MKKVEITIDEKWPVFTLLEPKEGHEEYQFEVDDTFWKEYCYIMYKYLEFQLKLQEFYECGHRKYAKKHGGYTWPEGASPSEQHKLNKCRDCPAEAQV